MTARAASAPSAASTALRRRLARRTLELVDIPSVSGDEDAIADHVARLLSSAGLEVDVDPANGVFAARAASGRPLVVLAGHLDTVPIQANLPGSIDGASVIGLGSCDMKGALAVMLELALVLGRTGGAALDLGFLFLRREELPVAVSAVPPLVAAHPRIPGAELVVVMEPTANVIELGCLGNIGATVRFTGRSAHSARPWLGVNAIHRALVGLRQVAELEPLAVSVGGLDFAEVISITRIAGGIADNVVPDEVSCHANFRYAPHRTPAEAEARLRELVGAGDVTIDSHAPASAPPTGNRHVARLVEQCGEPPRAKQAWTPVAEFSAMGLDAVNFGPGSPAYAHRRDERVDTAALVRSYGLLASFAGLETQAR